MDMIQYKSKPKGVQETASWKQNKWYAQTQIRKQVLLDSKRKYKKGTIKL